MNQEKSGNLPKSSGPRSWILLRIFTFEFSLENDTYDLPKHSTDFL